MFRYIAIVTNTWLTNAIFAAVICTNGNAQIIGILTDSGTRSPLASAEVFLNRTAIGSTSDDAGHFKLDGVAPGLWEIVIYKEGYSLYRSFMKVQPLRTYNINLTLTLLEQNKTTPISTGDSRLLSNLLLGESDSAVTILNRETIEKNSNSNLVATGPLLINNAKTGYQIKCFIADLHINDLGTAPLKFDILPYENIRHGILREKSRLKVFLGSLRHWLLVLAENNSEEKGYTVYDDAGVQIDLKSLVAPSPTPGYFRLAPKSRITIKYRNRDGNDETSFVHATDLVDFNKSGVLINPKSLDIEGAMAARGTANELPIDYSPPEHVEAEFALGLNKIFEKVYVHTDKPYYYPSEQIWFKAYMNYYSPEARGQLSKTLYVELVNTKNQLLLQKKLKLDSGFTSNNLILPDTIRPGQYLLRAYTQNQRNFGDRNLYLKPLTILASTAKPVYLNVSELHTTDGLTIVPDKSSYGIYEKVAIDIELKDSIRRPLSGDFSISVTDASQVLNIGQANHIGEKFPIDNQEINQVFDIVYPVEQGLTLSGQFINSNRKKNRTELSVVQFQPYQLSTATTDNEGFFKVDNLDFSDEAAFSIKPLKDDGKTNRVLLRDRERPPLTLPVNQPNIETIEGPTVQRILSEYEKPVDSKMLQEVTVKGERDKNVIAKNIGATARPYGVGEYVFDESKIKTQFPNLLYTLQALNISGLVVNPYTATIFFARHSKPVMYTGGGPNALEEEEKRYSPLVTLDNMPLVGGSAGEILVAIPPTTVGSIEVTKTGSSIRGTLAPFGVIAVYTKNGMSPEKETQSIGSNLIRVSGYATTPQFQHPSYEIRKEEQGVDFRSTLYWNPTIKVDAATGLARVYFYTSSLAGSYRIEVEGIDAKGKPYRSVSFIEVDN